MIISTTVCKFCSKKQSDLNLFCVNCKNREWEVEQIKVLNLDRKEMYLKNQFQNLIKSKYRF